MKKIIYNIQLMLLLTSSTIIISIHNRESDFSIKESRTINNLDGSTTTFTTYTNGIEEIIGHDINGALTDETIGNPDGTKTAYMYQPDGSIFVHTINKDGSIDKEKNKILNPDDIEYLGISNEDSQLQDPNMLYDWVIIYRTDGSHKKAWKERYDIDGNKIERIFDNENDDQIVSQIVTQPDGLKITTFYNPDGTAKVIYTDSHENFLGEEDLDYIDLDEDTHNILRSGIKA